jgi:hypothetical protein
MKYLSAQGQDWKVPNKIDTRQKQQQHKKRKKKNQQTNKKNPEKDPFKIAKIGQGH